MKPTTPLPSSEPDFPYGWRHVKRPLPDGGEMLERVPLTLEDVLHPQEGDVIPENTLHESDCRYLADVFATRPLAPPHTLVTRDLLVEWGVAGIRHHSPDVAVFVGLNRDPGQTGLLELRALGGRCLLIVEVVSPNTRSNDVVEKFRHYHQVGIPLYVIVDQEEEDRPRCLRAYRRTPEEFVAVDPDGQGRISLPPLGLLLGMRDNRVVCFDARTQQEMGDYARIVRALEEADRLAEQREQEMEEQIEARREAERRETEARREADRQREEVDRQREEADRQREEADRQRRAREEVENREKQASQRIRDLEELVRRLQGAGPGT